MPRPPVLDLGDIYRMLDVYQFKLKHTKGSHEQWEGYVGGQRRVVTVDRNDAPFGPRSQVLKSMIRQSGVERIDFYAAAGRPIQNKKQNPETEEG